jgi:hypothetical protein
MINVGVAWARNLAGRHDPIFLIQKVLKVFREGLCEFLPS